MIARAIVIGFLPTDAARIRESLEGLAEVVAVESEPRLGFDAAARFQPDVALVHLDLHGDLSLELTKRAAQAGGAPVVLLSKDRKPERILQAMRAGAADYAFLEPDLSDVQRAVRDLAVASKDGAATSNATRFEGHVIVTFGAKGGSGATTIATNLAGVLAQSERPGGGPARVVILDADFQLGDVTAFLDIVPTGSWHDLVRDMHRLDDELLPQALARHASGVHVVAQADAFPDAANLAPDDIARVLAFLKRHFDYVVVDGIHDFGEIALAVLDRADRILLVGTQDIPAIKNMARCLALFRRLGYRREKVRLVLSRFLKRGEVGLDEVADVLGVSVDATVANDFPTVLKSVNEGAMLAQTAPRAQVTKDIRALAALVAAGTQAVPARSAA